MKYTVGILIQEDRELIEIRNKNIVHLINNN